MVQTVKTLKFDVFGRDVLIRREDNEWRVFYLGNEGKRRPATDIIVPPDIEQSKLTQYLDDLLHEWATDRNDSVRRTD